VDEKRLLVSLIRGCQARWIGHVMWWYTHKRHP